MSGDDVHQSKRRRNVLHCRRAVKQLDSANVKITPNRNNKYDEMMKEIEETYYFMMDLSPKKNILIKKMLSNPSLIEGRDGVCGASIGHFCFANCVY